MRQFFLPFILLVVVLCLFLQEYFQNNRDLLVLLTLTSFFFSLVFFLNRKNINTAFCLIIISFSLLFCYRLIDVKKEYFSEPETEWINYEHYTDVKGTVRNFTSYRKNSTVFVLETEELYERGTLHRDKYRIRVVVNGFVRNLFPGDKILISLKFSQRKKNRNFGVQECFDWYIYRKINFCAFCKSALLIEKLSEGSTFWKYLGLWRNSVFEIIERAFLDENGEMDEKGVFLEALLTGNRGRLRTDTRDKFVNLGIFHLFSISGAHIGIISFILLSLFRMFNLRFRLQYVCCAFFILIYLFCSGCTISAQRAVIIALFYFYSKISGKKSDSINILCSAALFIITIRPEEIFNPGFVLTFLFSGAFVCSGQVFSKRKRGKFLREYFTASLFLFITGFHALLFFFSHFSIAGILTGLIFIPVTGIILFLGFLIMLLAPVSFISAQFVLEFCDLFLTFFLFITEVLNGLGNPVIYRFVNSPFPLIIVSVLILLLTFLKKSNYKRVVTFIILGCTLYVFIPQSGYNPDKLEVYFLDVGQGDCSVAVFPGGDALMIDGGGSVFADYSAGRNIVLPFILRNRINVRWILVTHYHQDHVKGVIELTDILKPEEIWIASAASHDIYYNALMKKCYEKYTVRRIEEGFVLSSGQCRVEMIYPEKFLRYEKTRNNHSAVCRIIDGSNVFLFTGDIEREAEEELVKKYGEELKADVLKVAHHGSGTSSGSLFLSKVSPVISVISLSASNNFGFPDHEVIKRLNSVKSRIMVTGECGAVKIVSYPEKNMFLVQQRDGSRPYALYKDSFRCR